MRHLELLTSSLHPAQVFSDGDDIFTDFLSDSTFWLDHVGHKAEKYNFSQEIQFPILIDYF